MLKVAFVVALIVVGFLGVESVNILWLGGLASKSHQIWGKPLQIALATKGYNLTVLSIDVERTPIENITFIQLENVYTYLNESKISLNDMLENQPTDDIVYLAHFRTKSCVPAFKSRGFQTLINYPPEFKFDLIIHDFAASQCLLGFVKKFGNPPLVALSASTCPIGISAVSGNPQYPAFVPTNHMKVGYEMTFLTRVKNSFLYVYDNVMRKRIMISIQNKLAQKYFDDPTLDVFEIHKSSLVTLVNLLPVDVMQPFFQNVIPVGGMHIQKPRPLDSELNNFIEKGEKGAVYFALGTNIASERLSGRELTSLMVAFRRFPAYHFIWKVDPTRMSSLDQPSNLMTRKWLPQNDILAHPKVRAFISHGGALSYQEATYYGVPMVLIPFVIDQKFNSAKAAQRGMGVVLDSHNLTTESIYEALHKVLNDPRDTMKRISKTCTLQKESPLERALYWTEYCLNSDAVSLLKSPGQNMPILIQFGVDVAAFVVFLVLFTVMIVVFLASFIWTCCAKSVKIKIN